MYQHPAIRIRPDVLPNPNLPTTWGNDCRDTRRRWGKKNPE